MYKMKTRIIVLAFFLYAFGNAQNPGYMGKKLVVGYGFYFNPAITAAWIDYGTKIINTQHDFFFEKAFKTRVSFGFSIKLYRTTYNNTGKVGGFYFSDPPGSVAIKARNYAFYLKFFRKKHVAPWGNYLLFGITVNTRQCTYDPEEMNLNALYNYGSQKTPYNDFGPTTQKYFYPDFLGGIGNSRIIRNKVVLDYGCNVNAIAFLLTEFDAFDDRSPYALDYIQVNSGMRVRGINRFNFFVKIGYLF